MKWIALSALPIAAAAIGVSLFFMALAAINELSLLGLRP